MIGKRISHYKIIEKLGAGGMGVVYVAEDQKLKRKVALKFLPSSLTNNEDAKKRFLHEAQAASALDHPNICTIHEINEVEKSSEVAAGQLYIVMTYYEGKTLKDKIEEGPLKIQDALKIVIQICEGLQEAHNKGIIHRDIKPANIFLTNDETVKILDFGLARVSGQTQLTQVGSTVGTAIYMSPEQAKGEIVDNRSDIWAIGVLLYEMITGQQPFKGEYDQALIYSIINESPEPPTALRTGVPMDLERIINKSIRKNPEERYQNLSDLIVDLRALKDSSDSTKTVISQISEIKSQKKKLTNWIVGIILVVFLTAIGLVYYFSGSGETIESIAILPLENLSGDPEQEYFVDGMTDALITELAQISALRVISRTSVMQYKGVRKPIQEIADELNVDALVEGTVLYDGDQVRITVQLIKAIPEQHLWASNYERNMKNIFELQGDVARNIANEINVTITPVEELRLDNSREVDAEAYKLYLKGFYNADKATFNGIEKSFEYYNKALEKDPEFALAYVGLAETYLQRVFWGQGTKENLVNFRSAAQKAIELDSTQSYVHRLNANLKFWFDWDMLGAKADIEKALELNPSSSRARDLYSQILVVLGQFEEAIIEREKAIELDPLSHMVHCNGGYTYYAAKRYDKAIELAKKTTEEFGSACSFEDQIIGWSYDEKGLYDQAIQILEKRKEMSTRDLRVFGELSRSYALAGNRDKARQILNELNDLSMNRQGHPAYYLSAITLTALGEKDKALDNLEKSYKAREVFFPFVKVDQRLDPLKLMTRFNDVVSQLSY